MSLVRESAARQVLYLPHSIRQMAHPDRMITTLEVLDTIMKGEVIEDYPDDARGHSCLVLGAGKNHRPIHVVCSPKDEYLAVITAYLPVETEWEADCRTRRPK